MATQTFAPGRLVKVNPKLFPADCKPDTPINTKFGMPGVFKDMRFKVVRQFHDKEVNADMVEVVGQDPRFKAQLFLYAPELVLVSDKIKVEYKILSEKRTPCKEAVDTQAKLDKLLAERQELKRKGEDKSTSQMRHNWKGILAYRKALKGMAGPEVRCVIVSCPQLPKSLTITEVAGEKLEDTITNTLLEEIGKYRSQRQEPPRPVVRNIHGFERETVGGVGVKPNWFGETSQVLRSSMLEQQKSPKDKDNYIGIEIEFFSKLGDADVKKALCQYALHKNVQRVRDGSLRADRSNEHGHELRVLAKESELDDVMSKLRMFFADKKVGARVNGTCGLHVHLDHRYRDVKRTYSNLFKLQDLLIRTQPSYRSESIYAQPIPSDNMEDPALGGDRDTRRRRVINPEAFRTHGTIEIRIHEGTVDTAEISNWCKFLMSIANFSGSLSKKVSNVSELSKAIPLDTSVAQHIQQRIEENAADYTGGF